MRWFSIWLGGCGDILWDREDVLSEGGVCEDSWENIFRPHGIDGSGGRCFPIPWKELAAKSFAGKTLKKGSNHVYTEDVGGPSPSART